MDILSVMKPLASSSDGLLAIISGFGIMSVIISLAVTVILLVAEWKLFSKAGEPGWKILIPIYNNYILFKIVYGNGWKFLLMLVPILDIILAFALCIRLAQAYGKDVGFGILTIFFAPIMMCVLGFGSSTYQGPATDKLF